jgi:hypothetical protein
MRWTPIAWIVEMGTAIKRVTMRGFDLDRPECVLAVGEGDLFVSHRTRGVLRICADGRQFLLGPKPGKGGADVLANGIALERDGSFVIANINDDGGIYRLAPDGTLSPVLTEIGGQPCPPVNFVAVDELGRIWFSVSSTMRPRHLAYRRDVKNGFVGVIDEGVVRIVVEGLHYTNEIRPDLEAGFLYVSETFAQCVTRFRIDSSLSVGPRQIHAQLTRGSFVDGIAQDDDGALWAACIVSNEVLRIFPDGSVEPVLSERSEAWINTVEAALDAQEMKRVHFDSAPTKILRNVSSVAFGGADRRQLYCGSLLGNALISLKVPVTGKRPQHWDVSVPFWGEELLTHG